MNKQAKLRVAAKRNGGPRRSRRGGGMTIVYLLVLLSLIFALASFAVDYGRVQLVRTQLRITTDVAAKWAVLGVSSGKSTVVTRANAAAQDNMVNGAVTSFPASDVQVGRWNAQTRVFTPNQAPYNAVKLTGTSVVPLMLGNIVNKPSVTVRVSAVARAASLNGLIGLNGITFNNNAFVGSYDSNVTTDPTAATSNSNATLSTNATLKSDKHIDVNGSLYYGGLEGSFTVTGESQQNSTGIVPPPMPTWSPSPNPGSITNGDYVHNGGALNAGTYWFASLTVNAPLTFNGPAIVHVNGDIIVDGNNSTITGYDNRPPNLTIYQLGTGRKFENLNSAVIKAVILAPGSKFEAKNNMDFYGLGIFDTITMKNNTNIFFDESAALNQAAALVQ